MLFTFYLHFFFLFCPELKLLFHGGKSWITERLSGKGTADSHSRPSLNNRMRKAGKLFSIIPRFLSWPKKGEMPGSVCFRRQFLQYDQLLRHRLKLQSKLPVSNPPFNRFLFSFLVAFSAGIFHLSPYSKKPFSKAQLRPHARPKGYTVTAPLFTGSQAKNLFRAPEIWNFPSPRL